MSFPIAARVNLQSLGALGSTPFGSIIFAFGSDSIPIEYSLEASRRERAETENPLSKLPVSQGLAALHNAFFSSIVRPDGAKEEVVV
mmetsp:Transcript_12749/g.46638  ORF Transcript_12749/g.46638 Transcript_12749/m.46638 type:complete len:87 (-) Transcript_12749:1080-1340(-)